MAQSSPTERRPPDSLRLLDSDEVGAMLGMDARSIRRMANLPRVELGHRTVRFRLDDVLAFIEANTRNAERRPRHGTPSASSAARSPT